MALFTIFSHAGMIKRLGCVLIRLFMINQEVKKYIDTSILCWLATVSCDMVPNVSPKEVFTNYGDEHFIIANIASPNSVRNIKTNPKVCVSFIDIFIQKGFQIKGRATIVDQRASEFEVLAGPLEKMTQGKYPFGSITKINIERIKPIIAPSYLLFADTTEEQQLRNAYESYGIDQK